MINFKKISYSIGDNIVFFIYGTLILIIYARQLSLTEYGLYVSAFILLAVLDLITNGFVNIGMVKFIVESDLYADRIFSSVIIIKFIIVLFWGLLILLFSKSIVRLLNIPDEINLYLFTPVIGLISILMQTLRQLFIAKKNLKCLFLGDLIGLILSLIAIFIAYKINLIQNALQALLLFGTTNFLFIIGLYLYGFKIIKFGKPSPFWMRKLINFGKYSLLNSASSFALEKVDGILILLYLSPIVLGAYDVARKISEGIIRNIVVSFSVVAYPSAIIAAMNGKDAIKKNYELYAGAIFFACIPFLLAMVLIPGFIMKIAYGDKYSHYSYLLIFFGIGSFFRPFAQIGGNTTDGLGKPNLTFIFSLVGVIFSLIINILLIPRIGIIAAAAASATFFIINSSLSFLYLKKKYNVSLSGIVKEGYNIIIYVLRKIINYKNYSTQI